MKKLSICRICLSMNAVHVIVDEQLQEIFEKLTAIPYQTSDMRPLALCYICHGQLKAAQRLMLKCLRAEELLTAMLNLNENEETKVILIDRTDLDQMSVVAREWISIGSAFQNVQINAKNECCLDDNDVKLEEQSMMEYPEPDNSIYSECDNDQSLSDSKDTISILKHIQNNVREENTISIGWQERTQSNIGINCIPEINYPFSVDSIKNDDEVEPCEIVINLNADNEIYANTEIYTDIGEDTNTETSTLTHTNDKRYVCVICEKGFCNRGNLERHNLIHSEGKPYVCSICNKGFNQSGSLKVHIRRHTGERPYACDVCNKRFVDGPSLKAHARKHGNKKNYICEVCGKGFYERCLLKLHVQIHTGEKPFACEYCHKKFNQKIKLINHTRVHTGEKPFVCEICNKRFSNNGSLIGHGVIHTGEKPFVCNVCNKAFNKKDNLKRHESLHTGERLYRCNVCFKRFNQKGSLTIHERTHTGEKPYACRVCGRCFADKGTLNKHSRIHERENS